MNQTKRKVLSGVLAVALLLQTVLPTTVFAAESAPKTIVGFSALEKNEYTLPIGADEAAVNALLETLPKTITAKVEYIVTEELPPVMDSEQPSEPAEDEDTADEPQQGDIATGSDATAKDEDSEDVPVRAFGMSSMETGNLLETTLVEEVVSEEVELAVTWESDKPLNTEKAGTFTYTAVLSDTDKGRYDFVSGVSLPELTVTVAEQLAMMSPKAATAPTVDTAAECIYANGTPITIEAGATAGMTKIKYHDGSADVYLDLDPSTADTVDSESDLSMYDIYGGANGATVATTSITMTGGTVGFIKGYGVDEEGNENGTVTERINIIVTEGPVEYSGITGVDGTSIPELPVANGFVAAISSMGEMHSSSFTNLLYKSDATTWYAKGSYMLPFDWTIPESETLTVPTGETLTISTDVTLTNNGTINAYGTLNHGAPTYGTIDGSGVIETYKDDTISLWRDGTVVAKAEQGAVHNLRVTIDKPAFSQFNLFNEQDKANFYLGNDNTGTKLGDTVTFTQDPTDSAKLIAETEWTPDMSLAADSQTIFVEYGKLAVGGNNFVTPRTANTTVTVSGVAEVIASDGTITEYGTLADAIANAPEDSVVKLLANMNLDTDACVQQNALTLDLNGKTLTSKVYYTLQYQGRGTLTIQDSGVNGILKSPTTTAVKNASTGTVSVTSGTVTGFSCAINNESGGKVSVSGGVVSSSSGSAIRNQGQSVTTISGTAKVTSNGVAITLGGGSYEKGISLYITGGTVESTGSEAAIINYSLREILVSGGTVSAKSAAAIESGTTPAGEVSGGKITISGTAKVTSVATAVVLTSNGYEDHNRLNITGGTVESIGSGNAIETESIGQILISGGTVSANSGFAIVNHATGTITIDGGVILGGTATPADEFGAKHAIRSMDPASTLTIQKGLIWGTCVAPSSGTPAVDRITADSWTCTGNMTLPMDAEIPQDDTFTVREGATLTIPTGVTLQNNGILLLDGGTVAGMGTLSGSGKFRHTITAASDIAVIPDQVYTGSAIEPVVSFTDILLLGRNFTAFPHGYTQSYENNTNVGTAKVVYTKNSDSTVKIEKEFNITQSGTMFDGGVTADKAAYTYGDIITIKAKPKATGKAPAVAGRAAPIANQMALYAGAKQISEPATADANGVYTMTYDTSKKEIAIGSGKIITAKYIGTANMADYSAGVTFTLNPKTITAAAVSAGAAKTYDGATAFSNVALTPNASDLISGDIVTATASGTVADANVGTAKAFTATAVTLGGTHGSYYSLAATAVSGNAAITKATATGIAQTYNFVENLAKPDYTYDLSKLLPGVTPPASLGTVTYTTTAGAGAVLSGSATISGSTITLPVKAVAKNTTQNITISITSSNYTIADATLTLTAVDKLPLNIAASITGRIYNGKALAYTDTPTFTKATDGTAVTGVTYKVEYEGVAPTVYTKSTTAPANAGTYKAIITVDGDSANFYMGSVDVAFTISKVALTVKADDKSALIGGAKPTYTATTTGLVNGETISGITFTDDNAVTTAKGSFTITPAGGVISGGGNDNYEITYQTGTLTVNIDVTVIDAAIAAANSAKNGIITSDQPASSVPNGTKFVTTAEMNALNSAISTATAAKATVNTAAEAQAAATALNDAVAIFTAAIKTGTYTSGDNTTVNTPPATTGTPNLPTQGNITVPPTISGDTATVTVTEASVKDAINKAQEEAKRSVKTDNGISVEIKTDTQNATNLTAHLPKEAVDALVSAGVKEAKITSGVATISLNLNTLQEIQKQAGADVTVTATKVANNSLSNEAKALVGNRPVYDLSITGKSGTKVESFGNGTVSVAIPYTLDANETAGNVVAYYIDGNGKAMEMPISVYNTETKNLSFVTSHFSLYAVGYKEKTVTFTDITNHPAKDSIEFVAVRGLLAGTGESEFSPNTSMTRGMFVTALGRLAGADVSSYNESSFTDVNAGTYYLGYIEWAVKNNIVQGMGGGKFAPDQAINREQMAVIMQNYAKAIGFDLPRAHAQNTFADNAKISGYAKDAVKIMQMAGVLAGKNGNKFDPQGTATRAEVSAVLKRFVELAVSTDSAQGWMLNDSGKWMFYENGRPVTGTKTISGVSYTFDAYGETADLPKNATYGSDAVKDGDS